MRVGKYETHETHSLRRRDSNGFFSGGENPLNDIYNERFELLQRRESETRVLAKKKKAVAVYSSAYVNTAISISRRQRSNINLQILLTGYVYASYGRV